APTVSKSWVTAPPTNYNYQFSSVNIPAGVSVTVPSGAVIRVTGTFTNAGTIVVNTGAGAGYGTAGFGSPSPALPGNSSRGATHPYVGSAGGIRPGGLGGVGLPVSTGALLLHPGIMGGGGGAGAQGDNFGGEGGGSITVLAKGALVSSGSITAVG